MSFNYFCHNIALAYSTGACLEWIVTDPSNKTGVLFWQSPSGEDLTTFASRIRKDTLAIIKGDRVLVQHLTNVYETTNFGQSFTMKPITSFMPVDTEWSTKEKTSATFSGAAFPNGVPASTFKILAWRFEGDNFWCCFNNDAAGTVAVQQRASVITKNGQVFRSGWGWQVPSETLGLRSTMPGAGWYPVSAVYDFAFDGVKLITQGIVNRNSYNDSFPYVKVMLNSDTGIGSIAESVALQERGGAQTRVEVINFGDIFTWGHNGASGSVNAYYQIKKDISYDRPYAMQFVYSTLPDWRDPNPKPTYQSTKYLGQPVSTLFPDVSTQRAQKWRKPGSQEMSALVWSQNAAGTSMTFYSSFENGGNGTKYTYGSEAVFAAQFGVHVVPVSEKGAYVYVERENSLRNIAVKVSATGRPGTFSPAIRVSLPTQATTNTVEQYIGYSATQNKFIYGYADQSSRINLITFDDVFTCALYEPA